jgi:hypothetical protein
MPKPLPLTDEDREVWREYEAASRRARLQYAAMPISLDVAGAYQTCGCGRHPMTAAILIGWGLVITYLLIEGAVRVIAHKDRQRVSDDEARTAGDDAIFAWSAAAWSEFDLIGRGRL